MKIKAIVTGSTGMVGEGVMHECLLDPSVEEVLIINRRPGNYSHPKLKEIIHSDFSDFSKIESSLKGYNACFHCMGVSSVGMKEDVYRKLTYDISMALMKPLLKLNPEMTVCYISGAGTDSSEEGKMMWARVKGKTENDILKMGFKDAYAFRPGIIQPTPGLKHTYAIYTFFKPLFPLLKMLFPGMVGTLEEIGKAMIKAVSKGYDKKVLEVNDIRKLASV